jgi:hypothetical protein
MSGASGSIGTTEQATTRRSNAAKDFPKPYIDKP